MKHGRWLFVLAVLPLAIVVAIRVAFRDRMGPDWKKEERSRVASWGAMATVPLKIDGDTAQQVSSIPLVLAVGMSPEKIDKLREAVERFVAYAHDNTFSRYWDFRVHAPYDEVYIPREIREFMGEFYPQNRLEGSPSNQLQIVFSCISFGTDMDHWGFEGVNYDKSLIHVQTNSVSGSLLEHVMAREFPTGYLLRTNMFFRWHSSNEALGETSPLVVATVKLFLASRKTGAEHAYPVYLALFWDEQSQSWIPEELGASGNPPPKRSLFF